MALSSEERVLPYTLCACTGTAIMFNVILLIWHCVKFKSTKDTRYLKYAFGGLTIAYAFLGLAITLLILYSDLGTTDLCKIGGFLVLFSTQESFWMLATSCLVLLLWIRSNKSRLCDVNKTPGEYHAVVSNKWSVPIFILLLVVKCIVLAIVSFLPMTNIAYFTYMDGAYYYLCIPLRLPHESGWPYSTLVVILNWIALSAAVLIMVAYNIRIRKRFTAGIAHTAYLPESKYKQEKANIKLHFWMNSTLSYNIAFWALILLLMSINYFSGGLSISQNSMQWTVGYLVSILIMSNPIVVCLLHAVMKTSWFNRRYYAPEESFMTSCPKKLESIQKLAASFQNKDINQYLVHWKDIQGHFNSGILKVFHPSANQKWRNEVQVLARIGGSTEHPNVLKYHWQSRDNRYSGDICMLTGDMLSLESGLICKSYYAHGNLYQFLKVRIHQLTEVGIHKLTLDVASGLDFIHSHCIVHNQLSTKCVYMASVSEKIGLRAVIGDFENSYVVQQKRNQHLKDHLYAISYGENLKQADKDNSAFSPDIRSFGVMVLEMLISLSEYNHNLATKAASETKSSTKVAFKNSPVVNYGQRSQSHKHHQLKRKHSRNSTGSGNVADLRAHTVNCKRHPSKALSVFSPGKPFEFSLENNARDAAERELSIDTYLDPIKERRDSPPVAIEMTQKPFGEDIMQKLQQRQLPAIPIEIEKVVNEVSMSAVSSSNSHDTDAATPSRVKDQGVKPKLKPKPNLLKSIQRSIIISGESGESDVDSIYPKSPANIQKRDTSTDSDQSPESTLSLSKSSEEKHEVVSDDMYNASVNSCGSFDTIYEDDESQEGTPQSFDSGLGKTSGKCDCAKKCDTVVKRKLPKSEAEVWKKKRLSGASFNDSILSGDSGMGSSHYGTSSEAQGGTTKERDVYTAGSRSAIYEGGPPTSDSDSYSLLMAYLERNSQKVNDDGTDSVLSSDVTLSSPTIELQNMAAERMIPASLNEENFDDFYEMLPDLMVRKKPCRGQHRHIEGTTCCTAPPKPPRRKKYVKSQTVKNLDETSSKGQKERGTHLYESINQSKKSAFAPSKQSAFKENKLKDPCRLLVDESTMTTDSLERKCKPASHFDSHGIQTDSESIITEVSCVSARTTTSRSDCCSCANGKLTSDTDSQISSKPPVHSTHKCRPGNVPKLGITAVAFSRQANNGSALSSPLSSSMCQTGSMQSLAAGRSSVMSGSSNGRQSARSLPGGSSSINNSVLTLLQDSNLYVSNAERNGGHQTHQKRSNKGVFQEMYGGARGIALQQSQTQLLSQVVTNHPVVQQIVELSGNEDTVSSVLDTLKRKGRLGYTAAQLVPLLKECWLEHEVPSTNQILVKLGQVLPTATV